ncbi:MAG: hypothetical protein C5B50_02445 [Verrucomicrobia bacterium]|nr:MAG: hypothetical protein C5B50_02445 [Verrucomicrobiota bacterium]
MTSFPSTCPSLMARLLGAQPRVEYRPLLFSVFHSLFTRFAPALGSPAKRRVGARGLHNRSACPVGRVPSPGALARPLFTTRSSRLTLLALLFLALPPTTRAAGPYGTDNGWAVDHSTGAIYLTSSLAAQMVQGETGWLRVEMFLVNGHSTWDSTVLGYYDTAVSNALNAGLQVMMLIDGGSWPGSQTDWCANNQEHNSGQNGENVYVEGFATNAVLPIVQHFHNRVKYYEIWNEPNCWSSNYTGGYFYGCTYIYPSNYGWLLARSWEAVHVAHGYSTNDITLFSGGVFGHNIGGVQSYANAGAQYLDDTYSTGTNLAKGASFTLIKTNYNAYPLDGIGEHLYIYTGGTVVSNTFRQYEDWVHSALTKYEGTSSPKKTFITEFGWQTTNISNGNGVSQNIQDTNLITSFSAINATPYVRMAIWFQWKDNPAGSLWYGVIDSSGNPKLSYPDYQRCQRFEGIYSTGATNSGIANYFSSKGGAPILGSPFDNGHGAWVYSWLNGYAQDCSGGAHAKLSLLNSTNGTFELNNVHGLWSYYQTNNGATAFGYVLDNEFSYGGGTRQDFQHGYLTWDSLNNIVWHPPPSAPTGLTAIPGNNKVSLHWNSAPTATGYNVKRAAVTGGPYSAIASGLAATNYTDTGVLNGWTNYYVVSATNSAGEGPNSPEASAVPIGPPTILAQPQSQIVNQGDSATFTVTASNTAPLSYQWQFNGSPIANATATALSLTNVQPSDAGGYAVVVSNYAYQTNSATATLSVRPLLTISADGVLTWIGNYTLQSATNAPGPYLDLTNAVSPYTNDMSAQPQLFFRLRQ